MVHSRPNSRRNTISNNSMRKIRDRDFVFSIPEIRVSESIKKIHELQNSYVNKGAKFISFEHVISLVHHLVCSIFMDRIYTEISF
jgi:hypothetical protein